MNISTISYWFYEAFESMKKNIKNVLISISTMIATMIIVAVGYLLVVNANYVIDQMQEINSKVMAFLETDITEEQINNINTKLKAINGVTNVEFFTKEESIKKQVPMVLSLVGLLNKSKMYPDELSGGEQQRVAVARAIVNNPMMLIADEPTGNLDPDNAWEIMSLLNDINRRGTTVVVATHAKEIVDKMQKRVIAIENGTVWSDIKKGVYSNEHKYD